MARILVIEDDPELLESLASYLARAGHEVVEASHGKEALQALYGGQVALVITDLNMPEMDGLEMLKALHGADIPVVAMSAP